MSIKVTLEFETGAEAAAFLQGIDDGPAVSGTEAGEKRGRGRPPKAAAPAAAAPAAAPAVAASVAAAPSVAAPAASASPAVPFKDVADNVSALAEKDLAVAKGILAKFGVAKASDLKPEQFGPVVEACKAALNPSTPAAASLI